jgi:hypothetical protein
MASSTKISTIIQSNCVRLLTLHIEKINLLFIYYKRDGFHANAFHSKCDDKGSTLFLIQDTNGYLFGGFSSNSHRNAGGSFIFTLFNPHNIPPTKYTPTSQVFDVCHSMTNGPCFGGISQYDIKVVSNSNESIASYSNFCTFADTTGKGPATFTGGENFTTNEIEVYSVI